MTPIVFSSRTRLPLPPDDIADQILDLSNWTSFKGYGPIPGIESAEFEIRTDEVVGTRFRIQNSDGSTHVEEIVEWNPERRLRLRMTEFSFPLSRLAKEFSESWDFECIDSETAVTRTFELLPTSVFARPALWLISILLRKASERHLTLMQKKSVP